MTSAAAAPRNYADYVNIRRVEWDEVWPDCYGMMLAHRVEVGQDDARAPLDPAHEIIERLIEADMMIVLSARNERAGLVGYMLAYPGPSLETDGQLIATLGPWYVLPEWRARGVGMGLWREMKRQLCEAGVSRLFAHYPAKGAAGASLAAMFAREGAEVVGTEVSLWLGPTTAPSEGAI